MYKKLIVVITFIIGIVVSYNIGLSSSKTTTKYVTKIDSIFIDRDTAYNTKVEAQFDNPQDNLYEALMYYGIKYPDVAYAIAVEETGWFKSNLCMNHNNLFGLYDSKHHRYIHFKSWCQSIIYYRDNVEKKYTDEDKYLQFLDKLPYSEDKEYINKLKIIINKIKSED